MQNEVYLAHISENDEQLLKEHLLSVAELAKVFSCDIASQAAYAAGLLHDIGKYSTPFQKRIRGKPIQVEHALSGALETEKIKSIQKVTELMLKYVVAGHHSGLPDGGSEADNNDEPTLSGRLKRKAEDYSAYKKEIDLCEVKDFRLDLLVYETFKSNKINGLELFGFFTRYIFSCLADADYIDTEKFFSPQTDRGLDGDFDKAFKLLETKMSKFIADTPVKKARGELLSQVRLSVKEAEDINLLNMPTGSGKTLASLAAAFDILKAEGKKRIIYVIPYTSIIEQTAKIFTDIFGDSVSVLQHHSNYDFAEKKDENTPTAEKLKAASENWDSPIIVTTNVQFFESLYHYKGSKLRKLHNLADSVMVFDEIHTLPIEYLQPCIRGIGYITKHLNSKAIFLSATMPNYQDLFYRYIPENSVKNLIYDTSCYNIFKRYDIHNMGEVRSDELALSASNYTSALIVTNTRKYARELYKYVAGNKYHLSTNMIATHRSNVILNIKKDLSEGKKIIVVSTSLIEAGVDLDFEAVYREQAGMDNILQAAGRCNREGMREKGYVYVFQSEQAAGSKKADGEMQIKSNLTSGLFREYSDVSDVNCIKKYFDELYGFNFSKIDANVISGELGERIGLVNIPFREYAKNFKLIEDATTGIIIKYDEKCEELLEKLKYDAFGVRRALQKYTVNVHRYEFEEMSKLGLVSEINGVFVLANKDYYSDEYGLAVGEIHDEKYIIMQGG